MNVMPNADPLFDLSACANALDEGHDPAEVAVRLRGIVERLRGTHVGQAVDNTRIVSNFATDATPLSALDNLSPVSRLPPYKTKGGMLDVGDCVLGRWETFPAGAVVDSGDGSPCPFLVRVGRTWVWADFNGPAFDWNDEGFMPGPTHYPDARFLGVIAVGSLGDVWRSALERLKS